MARLLQTMAGARHGGAEAFFERLAPALARAGMTQRLVIRRDPARAQRLRDQGLEVTELGFGGALDLRTRPRLCAEIKRFAPDLVLAWMNRAARFLPRPRPGVGAVTLGRLGGYYDLKYYRHCDHLIGNTRDLCDWIRTQGWPAERTHYLPNFAQDSAAAPLARATLDTPADVPLLVALGRLHPNKAFDVLLAALARLPGVFLWLAGEGPERAVLEAQARTLGVEGRVRFLGWRDDGPALLAAADLFVCPSRHEPLGNVVIEAWAAARPVVACRAQGPVELIKDGTDGRLVPIDDAHALARAVADLLADPVAADAMAQAGRRAFDSRFTEDAVVAAYLDLFARVRG